MMALLSFFCAVLGVRAQHPAATGEPPEQVFRTFAQGLERLARRAGRP